MPSWMKFAGLWGLAAIAALTLSWVAVSQVRDRVIQPVTVIPTTIVALAPETSTTSTVIVVEPTVDRGSAGSSTTTNPTSDSTSSQSSTTSSTRATSASPSTPSTTVPPPSTTSSTTTTLPVQSTTTTTAPSSSLATSSHSTAGGSVTIRSAPGEVHFVSAIPQSGFTTELRETGPEKVRVRFVSATSIIEFEAEWEDGQLDIETSQHTP